MNTEATASRIAMTTAYTIQIRDVWRSAILENRDQDHNLTLGDRKKRRADRRKRKLPRFRKFQGLS
jgi:hypothetical protein